LPITASIRRIGPRSPGGLSASELGLEAIVPLDPRVKRFLEVLAAGNSARAQDPGIAERRAQIVELMKLGGAAPPVGRTETFSLPGPAGPLSARRYSPLEARSAVLPGLLYVHGGGLVGGNLDTHAVIAQSLAHFGACRVLALDYRLAPEHPFPAALDDVRAVVKFLRAHAADYGIDPSRLGICGDSAGGTLAAAACQEAARAQEPPLALQVLLCPILDYSRRSGSRAEFASGYLLDQATLDHDLRHCLPGGADPTDPRLSPLRAADLSGVPRTIIHTAEFDPLRDEGREYFERLAHSGIGLSYTCHVGMIHLFYGLGAVIPYARSAFESIGREIRAALA
jgi:acetyl esterase